MSSEITNTTQSASRFALIKQLLALTLPISLGAMVQTSYHLINAFWVGRIDADAVAIVSLCFPINLLLISLAGGLSLGGSILIAQRHGAKDRAQVNHLSGQTLTALVLLALLVTALGFAAAPALLRILGAEERIVPAALTYLHISLASSLFAFLGAGYQSILRSLGEAKAPLLIIVPGVVVNALLNPVMIFGWGPIPAMGVDGAAYATLITQIISAVAGILLMLRPTYGLTLQWRNLAPDWPTISTLLRIGLPSSVEQSMGALTVSAMTVLAAKFGTIALASYGIVFRIMTFTIIPSFGLSMATAILLGQTLGAGDFGKASRIAKEAAIFGFGLMSVIAAGLFLAADPIAGFFVPNEPELKEHCALVLRIFLLSFPMTGIQMALSGAFRGAGDTMAAMVMSLIGGWVIQVPLCFALSQYTSLQDAGIWWGMVIGSFISLGMAFAYSRSHRWKHRMMERA